MADRKLFIGNLVRRITQEDLWAMYSTYGPLEECAKFHESFGFVRFLRAEDARKALKATQGMTLKNRVIKVEFAAATTSWRAANHSHCNECRSTTRYNIPPIRAADVPNHRGHHQHNHHHRVVSTSSSSVSPPSMGPIGYRQTSQSKSNNSELNSSATNSSDTRQSHVSVSSPSSSYAASLSYINDVDDYDCDLDSGYNDEHDSPILSSSTTLIPASPWYDMPIADEIYIWDFQLYADIAREIPVMKTDNSFSESSDDDRSTPITYIPQLNINDYF